MSSSCNLARYSNLYSSICHSQADTNMSTKEVEYFLSATKILMILVGHWSNRGKMGKMDYFYKKCRYTVIVIFSIIMVIFPYSVVADSKCQPKCIENFFNFIHVSSAIAVLRMLESKETKRMLDFIYSYENTRLKQETSKGREIYMEMSRKNNNIVKGCLYLAFGAANLWGLMGIK